MTSPRTRGAARSTPFVFWSIGPIPTCSRHNLRNATFVRDGQISSSSAEEDCGQETRSSNRDGKEECHGSKEETRGEDGFVIGIDDRRKLKGSSRLFLWSIEVLNQ